MLRLTLRKVFCFVFCSDVFFGVERRYRVQDANYHHYRIACGFHNDILNRDMNESDIFHSNAQVEMELFLLELVSRPHLSPLEDNPHLSPLEEK